MVLNWAFSLPSIQKLKLPEKTNFRDFVREHHAILEGLCSDTPDAVLPEDWLEHYVLRWLTLHAESATIKAAANMIGMAAFMSATRIQDRSKKARLWLKRMNRASTAIKENLILSLPESLSAAKSLGVAANRASLWQQLQRRLRVAVAPRGAKARLAKAFEVTPGAVTQWITTDQSRGTMPSAETTLRLLQWVEAFEGTAKPQTGLVVFDSPRKSPPKK